MTMQRRTFCVLGMIACCLPALLVRPARQALASAGDTDPQEAVAPAIPAEYLAAVLAGAGCQSMFDGDSRLAASGPDRYRGNAFSITLESQLTEFSMELRLSQDTDLHFSVFRVPTPPEGESRGQFCPIFIGPPISASPAGLEGSPEKAFYATELPMHCGGVSSGAVCTADEDCTAPDECKIVPLTLEAGFDYALAVAWGVEDVTYFKQPADAPPFPKPLEGEDGQILGSVARNGLALPLDPAPDACLSLTPFTSTVYSMEICLEPQPGACCAGDACEELKPEDCLRTPGTTFTRERLSCADLVDIEGLECPILPEACCIPGAGCVSLDQFTCEANLGTLPGGLCTDVPNPCTPKGACCQDRGACDTVIEVDCDALGGVYRGDDTTCSSIDPSCSFGACCVGASCLPLTLSDCAGAAGAWQGHGTLCAGDGSTCDPRGACCDGAGGCQDGLDGMTEAVCIASGGSYRGDWSTCDTLDVPCGKGACCTPAFGCLPGLDQSFCEGAALLGTYKGDDTSCDDQATQCPGTCCFMGACLSNTTPTNCAPLTGSLFVGYGLCCLSPTDPDDPCLDDPCAAPAPSEACCLPDASCMDVPPLVCSDIFGVAGGVGTDCVAPSCPGPPPTGACCLLNGLCAELTDADCTAESGIYDGDDTTCTLGSCGVCCVADGTCDDTVDVILCSLGDGLFFPGGDCVSAPCPSVGACCVSGETCDDLIIGHACGRRGGFFEGEGTTCDAPDPCVASACCQDDGTCTTATPSQCAAVGGATMDGFVCGPDPDNPCPQAVACCHDDGTCTMITETACTDAGGTPDPESSDICVDDTCPAAGLCCTPDESCADLTELACVGVWHEGLACTSSTDSRCQLGACCRIDGLCEDVVASLCTGIGEDFSASLCDAPTCDPKGACCIGFVCTVTTEEACTVGGGVYEGDVTTCTPTDRCVPTGACCTSGGICTNDVSLANCEADSGCYAGDDTLCAVSGRCPTGTIGFLILGAFPASGSVDARIPREIDDSAALLGWDSVEFIVDRNACEIAKLGFRIDEVGGDATPPDVTVTTPDFRTIRFEFSEPIEASSWIMIRHDDTADPYCLGAQPGDVDKDGTTDISDVGALITCLNDGTCDLTQCDIDRGGICTGADLAMLVNLLNGAGAFSTWDGQTLVASPCP